jgi:GNAT superfamily N-acetyltransferase
MPWHLKTVGGQVLVVRDRDQKVVGRHKDRKKATAQLKVLYSLEKAQFASRTEAARYAANQRWKNHTPKEKADATAPSDLKIVEIRGNETFGPYKDGTFTRRATFTVLDDDGQEMWVDVTAKGVKGSQFIEVEAKRGKKQIGYLWAETDHDGKYGQKGKIAIGQVDVVANERRKGVATALMRLGKRYNIGSETIYHSKILTSAGAAFAEDTEIEKASFGGDRSAAGRYAAQQRWKNHKKGETKPAVRERRMAEKFQEGPILKSGFDSLGFPKILTPAEAKERFGETVTMHKAYFASRGIDLYVDAQYSDGEPKFDTESPAYYATLQALDDVLDQVDTTKLTADPKNGLFPYVGISNYYQNSGDTTGGYFDSSRNDVALFMNVSKLVEESYTKGPRFSPGTVPQMAADVIQASTFGASDSIAARIAYGFTVHEMGHWIDYSLGVTDTGFGNPRSYNIVQRAKRDRLLASDDEQRFSDFSDRSYDPRGVSYSNTNYAERFAENFTAWFTMTKVNVSTINQLKSDLASRGGLVAVGAALEVLKQDRIVDNLLNWPSDHPVFLFAFRGEPFDVDAFRQQLLVGMIKASFGGDRSAAGRYAAEQRWKGNAKDDILDQVTVDFESDGKNSGTVWATDNATGKVIGALSFFEHVIEKVYVLPEYRRKSVASHLYKEAKKRNGGQEMKSDDYTVLGASFMSRMTGKEVFQSGDFSSAPSEWKSWLERLERDALEKASFGGDRSAAGRYAANMRWQGQRKVAGFVGKGVYKLGADGSIHPKALLEEMVAEHPDGSSGYHQSTEPGKWKALVCKNIATNMTDVSTKEIMDVLDGFAGDKNNHSVIKPTDSRHIREILDGTVKRFILTKDGSVIDASKEDYVARESTNPKLEPAIDGSTIMRSRIDFASKHWDQMAAGGQVFDADTPEGQIALKQAAVKPLVDAWATTANDAHELSLAIQDTAQKVFKVDALSWNSGTTDAGDWGGGNAIYSNKDTYKPSSTITAERTKVLSSFLLAQYAATQQYFDAKGIKEITLFRGMKKKPTDPDRGTNREFISPLQPAETAEILMRPLSSWATRLDDAAFFAKPSLGQPFGTIVKARIKTKDILSIPYTGVGCWEEAEVVVIGRPVQGSFRASYKSPIMNPEERRDYESQVTEWAYEDETGEAP